MVYICVGTIKVSLYFLLPVAVGEENGNQLQYSYLENPVDRGA